MDQARIEPPQDIIEIPPTQYDLIIHEEQPRNPQEQVLQELIHFAKIH